MANDTTFVDNLLTSANRIIAGWLNPINNAIWRGSRPTFATSTGAANVYILTLPATSLYIAAAEGDTFQFKAHQTNTGAATFSVVGGVTITAAALQVNGAALTGSEIVSGGAYSVTRVGSVWQLNDRMALPVPIALGGTGGITATAAITNLGATAGVWPIALGGTGQITAAAAFSALKQAATTSATGVIEIATTAEVQTGSATDLAVVPSTLLAAIGFSKYFQSADQTITSAGALTLAHGLGRSPVMLQIVLKCTTIDLNYAVNDLLFVPIFDDNAAAMQGASVIPDATNLNVRYGSSASAWVIPNKTSGARGGITNGSWVAIFRAWG